MPIMESILEAEAKAEKLRQKATDQVKIIMKETKKKGDLAVQELYEKAKEAEQEIQTATNRLIQDEGDRIEKENQRQNEQIAKQAGKKMDQAVDFLLEKVFES